MPVKIVDNTHGTTSIKDGTIKEDDVSAMTDRFKKEVGLTAIPSRLAIVKSIASTLAKINCWNC